MKKEKKELSWGRFELTRTKVNGKYQSALADWATGIQLRDWVDITIFVYSFADQGSEIANHGRLQKIEILKEMTFWG